MLSFLLLSIFLFWNVQTCSHSHIQFPEGTPFFENYESELTWIMADKGNVYGANQFWFESKQGGYYGGQFHVDENTTCAFSIWDQDEKSTTAHPDMAGYCHRFGGEGTGAACRSEYPFLFHRTYIFKVTKSYTNSSGQAWQCHIIDTVTKSSTKIGQIFLENVGGFSGYGNLQPVGLQFQEYYTGGQFTSKFGWTGPWGNDRKYAPVSATSDSTPDQVQYSVTADIPGVGKGKPHIYFQAGTDVETHACNPCW